MLLETRQLGVELAEAVGRGVSEKVLAHARRLVLRHFARHAGQYVLNRVVNCQLLDLAVGQGPIVEPQIVNLAFERLAGLLISDLKFCIGLERARERILHDLGVRLSVYIELQARGLAGPVVGERNVIPVPQCQSFSRPYLNRIVGPSGNQPHRELGGPPLDPDQLQVVEVHLVAAAGLGVLDLLQRRDRCVRASLEPDRQGECIAPIKGAYVAEADVCIPVETDGAADLPCAEGRVPCYRAAVAVAPRDVDEAAIQRVMSGEALARRARDLAPVWSLPFFLHGRQFRVGKRCLSLFDCVTELVELGLLLRRREGEEGFGVAGLSVEPFLGDGVEEGKKLVELFLRNRIVLVAVAARATHRHAHPDVRSRLDTVDDVLGLILLRDRAPLEVDHVIAVESRSDLLLQSGVREQISGQLLRGELIERHIAVESVDDPVTPAPHLAVAVDVVAVCVGVTGQIEPLHRNAGNSEADRPVFRRHRATCRQGTRPLLPESEEVP